MLAIPSNACELSLSFKSTRLCLRLIKKSFQFAEAVLCPDTTEDQKLGYLLLDLGNFSLLKQWLGQNHE